MHANPEKQLCCDPEGIDTPPDLVRPMRGGSLARSRMLVNNVVQQEGWPVSTKVAKMTYASIVTGIDGGTGMG